ncbi:MAG: P27 family phage terminase small subunit [Acidobacteria bacterium]|nr:P27 family phage terminase small subunit [Acidobacteriota bacterium]
MANGLRAPAELTDQARQLFEELAPDNPRADVGALAMLCQAWADWREARAFIAKEGASTYVIRDKDGNVTAVREFPQVAAARKAEALYLKLLPRLRLRRQ